MEWWVSWRNEPAARALADRHYNRQSPGSPGFVPPGRCLVLRAPGAVWVSSWPLAEYVGHEWAGAWINTLFRRESGPIASRLILEAVAATRWKWPRVPPLGLVTFVDRSKIRPGGEPGYCYLQAGFRRVGHTAGGLVALQLLESAMPPPLEPLGAQTQLLNV